MLALNGILDRYGAVIANSVRINHKRGHAAGVTAAWIAVARDLTRLGARFTTGAWRVIASEVRLQWAMAVKGAVLTKEEIKKIMEDF